MKKRIVCNVLFFFLAIALNCFLINHVNPLNNTEVLVSGRLMEMEGDVFQVFWGDDMEFNESASAVFPCEDGRNASFQCSIPASKKYIRFDFGTIGSQAMINDLKVMLGNEEIPVFFSSEQVVEQNLINHYEIQEHSIMVQAMQGDPYIVFEIVGWDLPGKCAKLVSGQNHVLAIVSCFYCDFILLFIWIFRKNVYHFAMFLAQNGGLIRDLAVNDFKTRFAGAAFGTVWAFIQPIVTILVYWFVFQVGLRAGNTAETGVPYALWLSTGLIPWFFFSEAWNGATNSLIEYSYLVKKVVFNISIVPSIKVFSALIVHVFFVVLLLVMYLLNGILPTMFWMQIIYYSFAMFVLVIALTYMSSAMVLFFRDMSQIIMVILQIGVWMTPIMWQLSVIPASMRWLFQLNPMYYIVNGYRQSLIEKVPIWNNVYENMYFWTFTLAVLLGSHLIFEKLKPHFADVL